MLCINHFCFFLMIRFFLFICFNNSFNLSACSSIFWSSSYRKSSELSTDLGSLLRQSSALFSYICSYNSRASSSYSIYNFGSGFNLGSGFNSVVTDFVFSNSFSETEGLGISFDTSDCSGFVSTLVSWHTLIIFLLVSIYFWN